ncbi:hypothetical protein HY041_00935 [Candidatus Roizmanbacteria bacterium]|nr:hypothetical protein [Candidatus Roizmanbacteria bacterium]
MEDTLKLILRKLDSIESRLNVVEGKDSVTTVTQKEKSAVDPVYEKAVKIVQAMKENDEISSTEMQKKLGIDAKKAEELLDRLASAGFGETYMGEAK